MLERLVFRSAIPFGYLVFFVVLVLGGLVGAVIAVVSALFRRLRPWGVVAGLGLVLLVGVVFWVNIWFEAALEMNPYPVLASELVGTWSDRDARLELRSDATFQLDPGWLADRLHTSRSHGNWALHDWNLLLTDGAGQRFGLRVIQFRREYRIIIEDYDDPDMWDGRLGFRRAGVAGAHGGLTSNKRINAAHSAVTALAMRKRRAVGRARYAQR